MGLVIGYIAELFFSITYVFCGEKVRLEKKRLEKYEVQLVVYHVRLSAKKATRYPMQKTKTHKKWYQVAANLLLVHHRAASPGFPLFGLHLDGRTDTAVFSKIHGAQQSAVLSARQSQAVSPCQRASLRVGVVGLTAFCL